MSIFTSYQIEVPSLSQYQVDMDGYRVFRNTLFRDLSLSRWDNLFLAIEPGHERISGMILENLLGVFKKEYIEGTTAKDRQNFIDVRIQQAVRCQERMGVFIYSPGFLYGEQAEIGDHILSRRRELVEEEGSLIWRTHGQGTLAERSVAPTQPFEK